LVPLLWALPSILGRIVLVGLIGHWPEFDSDPGTLTTTRILSVLGLN
jgi:hypothetical protein